MFVIPLAMRLGAPISVQTLVVKNLIPATIGNIIGGAIFVAMAMGLSYGSWEKKINAAGARLYHRIGAPDCGLVAFGAANVPVKDSPDTSRAGTDGDSVAARAVVAQMAEHGAPTKSVAVHPAV